MKIDSSYKICHYSMPTATSKVCLKKFGRREIQSSRGDHEKYGIQNPDIRRKGRVLHWHRNVRLDQKHRRWCSRPPFNRSNEPPQCIQRV